MGLLVVLALLAIPVLELYVFVEVANAIGFWWALFAAVGISLGGAWLVKHQGIGVGRRFQQRVARGEVPDREVADGTLLLFAGLLLLFPGFVTGIAGLLLLLPPVRALVRPLVLGRRGRRRVIVASYRSGPSTGSGPIEATSSEVRGELDP